MSQAADTMRVLVADDEPSIRFVLQEVLESLGHAVVAVEDGDAALRALTSSPFDLAFLEQELRFAGLSWPCPVAEIDTVDLSMKLFPDAASHKLGDLARRLDVPLENAHRATDDAAACGLSLARLLRRHDVGDDLQALLDWAGAIGRPPEDGPLASTEQGVVFTEGPHDGRPVAEFPLHLQWMLEARTRGPNGWQHRYAESSRRWIRRWLDVRGSGRAQGGVKPIHPDAWQLDSCVAVEIPAS